LVLNKKAYSTTKNNTPPRKLYKGIKKNNPTKIMTTQQTPETEQIEQKIFQKIYRKAQPGTNYLKAKEEDNQKPHYQNHYLEDEKITEIINQELDKHGLDKEQRTEIYSTVMKDAPISDKEIVRENRKKLGITPI